MSTEVKTEKKEMIDFETRMKDKKFFDDIDFDKVELFRGKTPQGIEQKCLDLCKEYLSGNWSQQTIQTVEVRRITGGLMNQIYYCGIRQPDNSEAVSQEVAIKFYGDHNPFNVENKNFNDLIVSLFFSEKNLGPKVYGCFEGGIIQKFYKHRPFAGKNETDPQIVRKVFGTLARIHSIDFPIKKNANKQLEDIVKTYEENEQKLKKLIEKYDNCETFKKYDLKTEINWIKGLIERLNSPVVCCHSDFRSSNLMITEPNDELVVCDYDLTAYGYRGQDFVFLMREWNNRNFFQSMKTIEGLPLQSELRPFIEVYVDECQRIYGKSFTENENNCVEHIIKEAKIFLMFSYLCLTFMVMKPKPGKGKDDGQSDPEKDEKFHMEMLETFYKNYIKIKEIFKDQKLFD